MPGRYHGGWRVDPAIADKGRLIREDLLEEVTFHKWKDRKYHSRKKTLWNNNITRWKHERSSRKQDERKDPHSKQSRVAGKRREKNAETLVFLSSYWEPPCYGPKVCILQTLYVEALNPNILVFGGGAFRRWSGHENGVSV